VALLALVLGACAAGSSGTTSDEDRSVDPDVDRAVRALLEAQRLAWNDGDLEAFVEGYWTSPDVVFASKDGVRLGTEDLLTRYRERYPDRAAMGEVLFDPPRLSDLGDDHVLAEGVWALRRDDGPRSGRYVLVLRRIDDAWRIVLDYTTQTKGG
jgi:uncharacterized protein (TIGR02246 family)